MEVVTILNTFVQSAVAFFPKLLSSVVLLLIGWIIGSLVGKLTKEILKRARLDEKIARGRKTAFKISDVFSVMFEWVIYLVFIQAAVEMLEINALILFFQGLVSFLPKLIEAIILVVVGYAIGEYVREQIIRSEVSYAETIGSFIFFLVIYISVALALPLIGIDPFLVNAILLVIVGSVGVGLSIAIGWGLKDLVAQMTKRYLKKLKKKKF